jgi:hypothetical protein
MSAARQTPTVFFFVFRRVGDVCWLVPMWLFFLKVYMWLFFILVRVVAAVICSVRVLNRCTAKIKLLDQKLCEFQNCTPLVSCLPCYSTQLLRCGPQRNS